MLESMTKEEIQQIADSLQLDEAEMNPSQDKKRWTAEEDRACPPPRHSRLRVGRALLRYCGANSLSRVKQCATGALT